MDREASLGHPKYDSIQWKVVSEWYPALCICVQRCEIETLKKKAVTMGSILVHRRILQ